MCPERRVLGVTERSRLTRDPARKSPRFVRAKVSGARSAENESGVADKIYFYYAPKVLGGTHSVPVAGGPGRRRRTDAIEFERVQLHQITKNEFAVEAWLPKEPL